MISALISGALILSPHPWTPGGPIDGFTERLRSSQVQSFDASRDIYRDIVTNIAKRYNLDKNLIHAIIWVESKGEAFATRYEEHFKWTHRVGEFSEMNMITRKTEEIHQKTSWGLMQIMGGTARWLGYIGQLPAILQPTENIEWGCEYLLLLKKRYGNMPDVIAAYNAGEPKIFPSGLYRNQKYVDKVLFAYNKLTRPKR